MVSAGSWPVAINPDGSGQVRTRELSLGSFDYAQDARKEARIFGLIKSVAECLLTSSSMVFCSEFTKMLRGTGGHWAIIYSSFLFSIFVFPLD